MGRRHRARDLRPWDRWRGAALRLVVGLAVTSLSVHPQICLQVQAHAVKPTDPTREAVEELYDEAGAALAAGEPRAAAAAYAEVLVVLVESPRTHGARALALADAIEAYQASAAAAAGAAALSDLCAASALLSGYVDGLGATYGDAAAKRDGWALAGDLEEAVDAAIAASEGSCTAAAEGDDGDDGGAEAESEASPEPVAVPAPGAGARDHRWWILGGGVSLGVGGLLLGVMTAGLVGGGRANREIAELRREDPGIAVDDPDVAASIARGRRGDRLAVAGGILGGAAILGGVFILTLGLRGRSAAAERPLAGVAARLSVTPQGLGIRF